MGHWRLVRLLLTALLCMTPVILGQVAVRTELRRYSDALHRSSVLAQANQIVRVVRAAINDAIETANATTRIASAHDEATCDATLAALVRPPSAFRLIITGPVNGQPVCASDPSLRLPPATWPAWMTAYLRLGDGEPGGVVVDAAISAPFIPIALRSVPAAPGQAERLTIIGLDPAWLAARLDNLNLPIATLPGNLNLLLLAGDGAPILGLSPSGTRVRLQAPDWLPPAIIGSRAGIWEVPVPDAGTAEIVVIAPHADHRGLGLIMPVGWNSVMPSPEQRTFIWLLLGGGNLLALLAILAVLWLSTRRRHAATVAAHDGGILTEPRVPSIEPAAMSTAETLGLVRRLLHRLNNTLATIQGNVDLLQRLDPQGLIPDAGHRARFVRYLTRAAEGIGAATTVSHSLRAATRSIAPAPSACFVNPIIQRVAVVTGQEQVSLALAADLWPAMIDPSHFETGLLRLCMALTPCQAGATPTPWLVTSANVRGLERDHVVITVAVGALERPVEAGDADRLARPFGGDVMVDLAQADGMTRIAILLPRAPDPALSTDPCDTTSPSRMVQGSRGCILLVDDDDAVRRITAELLMDLGYEVREASGGEAALRMCDSLDRPPDLALVDYAMPGMTGATLAQRLRASGFAAPIVLVTGYAEAADGGPGSGALSGVLHKPFTGQELRRMLDRWLPPQTPYATAAMHPGA